MTQHNVLAALPLVEDHHGLRRYKRFLSGLPVGLLPLLLVTLAGAQSISVTSCGADPTGKLDSTSAFAKCLAQQTVGDITIPYGTYKLSSPIFKSRNQNLVGSGSTASILKCQSLNEPCIVAADTSGGPNVYSVSKIQNLVLQGPGVATTSIGVLIGGDPSGTLISKNAFGDGVMLIETRITGFEHGVQWGNNAWGNKIVRSYVFANATGLYAPASLANSGEALSITDSSVFNNTNGLEDHGGYEWLVQGSAFDYNQIAFYFTGSTIHAVNTHFEQQNANVFFQPYGSATLSLRDSEILVQANTGVDTSILNVWPQYLNLSINDVSVWSNHAVKYFMQNQGYTAGTITNIYGNGNKLVGALASAPTTVTVTAIQAF